MAGGLFVAVFALLVTLCIASAWCIDDLVRRRAGVAESVAMFVAAIAGLAVGWHFAWNFQWQPDPRVIVYSFPLPAAFHLLERYPNGTEQWVDFVTPWGMFAAMGNLTVFTTIPFLAAWFFGWWRRRMIQRLSDRQRSTSARDGIAG